MDDAIKKVLSKYDELSKLILDQKMDEMADKMMDIPADSDECGAAVPGRRKGSHCPETGASTSC